MLPAPDGGSRWRSLWQRFLPGLRWPNQMLRPSRVGFSPRQCDLLMVMGTIAKKMGPVVKQVYLQMAEPRWVIAVGACACSGGIFDTYSVLQGIDQVVPVDVYVPGCPPRPEAIIDGILRIQDLVGKESLRRRGSEQYKGLLDSYGIQ